MTLAILSTHDGYIASVDSPRWNSDHSMSRSALASELTTLGIDGAEISTAFAVTDRMGAPEPINVARVSDGYIAVAESRARNVYWWTSKPVTEAALADALVGLGFHLTDVYDAENRAVELSQ